MVFDGLHRRWRSLWSTRAPESSLAPRRPLSGLKPFVPPPPAASPPLPPADLTLLRDTWHAHLRHNPGMTAAEFIAILERRHRFFAEERRERQAKLAKLNAEIRPLP